MNMKICRIGILLAILFLIGSWICRPLLQAQSGGTGALAVTVNDPNGGVIVGATVKISNNAAVTRSQTTGANGSYTFTLLAPGSYEVSISAAGFQPVTASAVTVDVTETKVLNQSLQIGIQTDEVLVSSTAEMTQTQTSALGSIVSQSALVSIPLATRNFTQILGVTPFVETNYDSHTCCLTIFDTQSVPFRAE
jgi:hypothetical protein